MGPAPLPQTGVLPDHRVNNLQSVRISTEGWRWNSVEKKDIDVNEKGGEAGKGRGQRRVDPVALWSVGFSFLPQGRVSIRKVVADWPLISLASRPSLCLP